MTDPQHRMLLECAWEASRARGTTRRLRRPDRSLRRRGFPQYLLANVMPSTARSAPRSRAWLSSPPTATTSPRGSPTSSTCEVRASPSRPPARPRWSPCTWRARPLARECDLALAGGARLSAGEGGIPVRGRWDRRPDGHCRPFDARAQGTVFGSGAGIVVLKRLDDALADGDAVHAVIRGSAINNDGAIRSATLAPSIEGQARRSRCAGRRGRRARHDRLRRGARHRDRARDPIEIAALTRGVPRRDGQRGVLRHRIGQDEHRPPRWRGGRGGADQDGPGAEARPFAAESAFRDAESRDRLREQPVLRAMPRSRVAAGRAPRRAGVSSFGVGGTNAHVVLEEAPEAPAAVPAARPVAPRDAVGARPAGAGAATSNLAAHLSELPELRLADVAYTLQVGRRAFAHRRASWPATLRMQRQARGPGIRSACSPASPRPGGGSPSCSRGRAPSTSAWAAGCTGPSRCSAPRRSVLRPARARLSGSTCGSSCIRPEDGPRSRVAPRQTALRPAGALRRRIRPGLCWRLGRAASRDDRPQHRRVRRRLSRGGLLARGCADAGRRPRPAGPGAAAWRDAGGRACRPTRSRLSWAASCP